MSVSLQEVLESAGYRVDKDPKDASWFLSQLADIDELKEKASDVMYEDEMLRKYGDDEDV